MTRGSRIRLEATGVGRIQGTVVEIDAESLLVDVDAPVLHTKVPRTAITKLDLGVGQRRHIGKGALIGVGIGLAVAAVAALADEFCTDTAGCIGLNSVLTVPVGFAAGAVIGACIETERWTAVSPDRVRVSLVPTARREVRLAMSVTF